MHKRVLNVLAISIRRAHRVFERNSKLHHWSNSDTLRKYSKSIEKTKSPSFWHKSASFWHKSASFRHKSVSIACQSGARAAIAALLRQFSPAAWIRLDLIELRLKQIQSSNSNLRSKIRISVRRLKFVQRKYPPQWVSWVGVGRPGSSALPPPTTRPFGRAAGVHYPLAVCAGDVVVGTRHQPHRARSCELALRAVGAA